MAAGSFLNPEEEKVLVARIGELEKKTSGEICVHISKKSKTGNGMSDAKYWFHKLGVHKTKHRNGILIYVAVRDRFFTVAGDRAAHEIVGDAGWSKLVHETLTHFKKGDHLVGLLHAVDTIGQWLSSHFPLTAGEKPLNAVSDEITKDE